MIGENLMKERGIFTFFVSFVICLCGIFVYSAAVLNMSTRRDLCLEDKINLIEEKERGASHCRLSDQFQISVGSVSNILKRKAEYTDDYEANRNKKLKHKVREDSNQSWSSTSPCRENRYDFCNFKKSRRKITINRNSGCNQR
jgi:hypothetical protein